MDVVVEQSLLGDDNEAEIASWSVTDGTLVKRDDVIAELETSKVIVELLAPISGTLTISVQVGEVIEPGAVIATIA